MKNYLNYAKDILRLTIATCATALIIVLLPFGAEDVMGIVILALLLWISFLLDSRDPRNHARAAILLTRQANVQFRAMLPIEFTHLVERVEKLAKSGINLDDLFPVDGVARGAKPVIGGALQDDGEEAEGFRLIHKGD